MKKNILIIILSMLVLGMVMYSFYIKDNVNNISKLDNIQQECTNQNNDVIIDYDISKAEALLDYFGFNESLGCSSLIYSKFYNDNYKIIQALENVEQTKIKTMNCSDIYSESDKDSYGNYKGTNGVCKKDGTTSVISYEDVNELYKKMYGVELEKVGVSGLLITGLYYKFYDYNQSLDSFIKLECGACGGACGENFNINEIKSAKTVENDLVIQVYYLTASPNYNRYAKQYSYNLETSKGYFFLEANSIETLKQEIINNHLDKLDIYEIRFEKNNNDEYIFKSLSQILS